MSLQVRRSTYRGTSGWLLCGRPEGAAFPVKVFFENEEVARRERAALVANPNHQLSFRPVDTTDREGLT
ncbi:MAG TPA: hypothetical protein PKY13_09140 [Microthrixaceae bacterium]|nr:hypothetical protein [Microthrixaceae bacterium]HQF93259.1 hypothetical protein [Microthrixaceae bacterium]